MTYALRIALQGDYVLTEWFIRSVAALDGGWQDMSELRDAYEKTYDVRIGFDEDHMMNRVEFENQEKALEFLLRWA